MTRASSGSGGFVDAKVTYHIEADGSLIVVENVPSRVDIETGETLFSPQTVARLQHLVREQSGPSRVIEASVYDYA